MFVQVVIFFRIRIVLDSCFRCLRISEFRRFQSPKRTRPKFHDDDLNYSYAKQTAQETNGNFYFTAWEGTWVKNLDNVLPT